MKIGIVLSSTPGKSETFLFSMIKGLIENGHEISVFANVNNNFNLCPIYLKPKVNKNILFQFFKFVYYYSSTFIINPNAFIKYLNLEKQDGVKFLQRWKNLYFNSYIIKQPIDWLHFSFTTLVLKRENVALSINAKMSTSIRGYDISIYPLKNPGCYTKVWSKIDKIHAISKDLLTSARIEGLNDLDKTVIIHPAIDEKYFRKNKKTTSKIYGKDKILFLTVARLHWKKGLEDTIYAMSILKKNNIPFEYTIIGEGVEIERLSYIRNQLNMNKEIIFAGPKNHNEIRSYYENADSYIQYSIQEGFSNAVVEAQSMELVIFVSNAEGLSENIKNDKTGWVINKYSPEDLAEKIKEVFSYDHIRLEKIRFEARKRVLNKYTLDQQIKNFDNFFK